jgi:hypothetical protein
MSIQPQKATEYKEGMIVRFDRVLDTPSWAYAKVISRDEFVKNTNQTPPPNLDSFIYFRRAIGRVGYCQILRQKDDNPRILEKQEALENLQNLIESANDTISYISFYA